MGSFLGLQFYSIDLPACFYNSTIQVFNHYYFVIQLEARDGDSSRSSFIVENCFGYPGVFFFPYEVENCSLHISKELCWNFDGDCIESVDCFW